MTCRAFSGVGALAEPYRFFRHAASCCTGRVGIETVQVLVEQLQIHLSAEHEARLAAVKEKAELQKQLEAIKKSVAGHATAPSSLAFVRLFRFLPEFVKESPQNINP